MNKLVNSQRSRWYSLVVPLLVIFSLLLGACQAPAAPAPAADAPAATEAPAEEAAAPADAMTTIYGTKLPDDAAPYEEQVLHLACDNGSSATTFDFTVAVYNRYCLADLFQDTLIDLDKDFNVVPASAESWEVADDGVTWTFHIKPGLQWSDGTPLTAYDWEATYRYAADPEHAWDFTWFYAGVIKNWDEVVAGEVPVEELGVVAVDDLTLQIITKDLFPPLPGMMKFSFVMQKKAMEEHGPYYNNDPATSVSAGPFMLESFEEGKKIVVVANPNYKGFRQPRLQRLEGIFMSTSTMFAAFQNGEIDEMGYGALSPADFELVLSDPVMSQNYLRHFGDFRTDYLVMDTYTEPFNNLDVRKAFAHAFDREAIIKNVYTEIKALPAYSMLMPGFPSSDVDGKLKEYQNFDCDLAKQHLSDAGFPGGEGFPKLEMWLRGENPTRMAVYQAVAASIAECLSVEIEISNKDRKVYMDALNADPTQIVFGAVDYGMDFLDPVNMLGIWLSTGRHSWKNDEFDNLVIDAGKIVDDPVKRDQMFREAERILVDDVGGIFVAHEWQGDLFQPYVQGDSFREPDSNGVSGQHWGNDWIWGNKYIAKH